MHMYKVLMDLNPSDLGYIKRHTHYLIQIKELEQKIGKRPIVNDLDGIPSAIKVFVKKRVQDKRSIDFEQIYKMGYFVTIR